MSGLLSWRMWSNFTTQHHTSSNGHTMWFPPRYHFVVILYSKDWLLNDTPHQDCPMNQCDSCCHNRVNTSILWILSWWSRFLHRYNCFTQSHLSQRNDTSKHSIWSTSPSQPHVGYASILDRCAYLFNVTSSFSIMLDPKMEGFPFLDPHNQITCWKHTVGQVASDILRRGVELRYHKLFPQLKFYFTFYSSYKFP